MLRVHDLTQIKHGNSATILQICDSEMKQLVWPQNADDFHSYGFLPITYEISSLDSKCVLNSMYRSLEPVEEENCLVEKMHHDGIHRYTEPDSNQIIHRYSHENNLAIIYMQTDRGDKPPVNTLNIGCSGFSSSAMSNNLRSFASTDDGTNLNETTVGLSSGCCTATSDYSEFSLELKLLEVVAIPCHSLTRHYVHIYIILCHHVTCMGSYTAIV